MLMKEALTNAIKKANELDEYTNDIVDIIFTQKPELMQEEEKQPYQLAGKVEDRMFLAPSIKDGVMQVPCIVSASSITPNKKRLYTLKALKGAMEFGNKNKVPVCFEHQQSNKLGYWSDFKIVENKNGIAELHAVANITNEIHFATIQDKYKKGELKTSISIEPKDVIKLVDEFEVIHEISFVANAENTNCYALSGGNDYNFNTPKEIQQFLREDFGFSKKQADNFVFATKQCLLANKENQVGEPQEEQVGDLQATTNEAENEALKAENQSLKAELEKSKAEFMKLANFITKYNN